MLTIQLLARQLAEHDRRRVRTAVLAQIPWSNGQTQRTVTVLYSDDVIAMFHTGARPLAHRQPPTKRYPIRHHSEAGKGCWCAGPLAAAEAEGEVSCSTSCARRLGARTQAVRHA